MKFSPWFPPELHFRTIFAYFMSYIITFCFACLMVAYSVILFIDSVIVWTFIFLNFWSWKCISILHNINIASLQINIIHHKIHVYFCFSIGFLKAYSLDSQKQGYSKTNFSDWCEEGKTVLNIHMSVQRKRRNIEFFPQKREWPREYICCLRLERPII
jgi:ABC-type bacteriocin/lantibiotic exporter with double-glycine peptidase domain